MKPVKGNQHQMLSKLYEVYIRKLSSYRTVNRMNFLFVLRIKQNKLVRSAGKIQRHFITTELA
jgi:hypothetical protein